MAEATIISENIDVAGLSEAEVARRVASGEVNRVHASPWPVYRRIVLRNVFTLFNALVVPAAIALFLLGEWRGAVAVSGMALLNSVLGLAQELRAKRHIDRLSILAEPQVRVRRGGETKALPAGDLVRGDFLLLSAGEPVVADGVVMAANHLEVDEALLTGESDPVPAAQGRRLLSGSFCVAGSGVYCADQVGKDAYAQQTSLEARRYQFLASPLQLAIDRLIGILTLTAIVLCLLYVVLYFVQDFSAKQLVAMIAATITSMVPQGLVLFTTLAFILGAVRMTARGAIVQKLSAVESMADLDVLCLDKTGTLTTGRLRLEQVQTVVPESEAEIRRLLAAFAWNSMDANNKAIEAIRAEHSGGDVAGHFTVVDQLPFKSQNRYSAVRLRGKDGSTSRTTTLVLGACESLRPYLNGGDDSHWETLWQDSLTKGLRVLLLATADADDPADTAAFDGRLPPLALRPLAVIGLGEEVRPDAAAVLASLARQGMRVKIISGDHPDTVLTTIRRLGLSFGQADAVTGAELAATAAPAKLIDERSIFARVLPSQKVQIVETLQQSGQRVAMVGDGINDILAIKRADLGIALGDGSAATRTVAGLVLENNRFELLPETLAEGRNILRNLRRAGKIFLLKNVYTLLLIVATLGLFQLPFPYLPQQVTLLNKLTIGVPVLVITLCRTASARAGHAGFLWQMIRFALGTGAIVGLCGLAVMLVSAHGLGDPEKTQRTMLLSTLVLLGLGNLPRILTAEGERLSRTDRYFLWWLPLAILSYIGVMYLPLAADFFQLTPLEWSRWAVVFAAAALAMFLCLGLDWIERGRP